MAKHQQKSQIARRKRLFSTPELPQLFTVRPLPKRKFRYARAFGRSELIPLAAAYVLFAAAVVAPVGFRLKTVAYAAAALVAMIPALLPQLQALRRRKLPDEDVLPLFAALLAFLAGHGAAGALLALFGRTAQLAESYVLARADRGVDALSELLPEKAHVEEDFGLVDVVPEELRRGDCFLVYEGESVPTDGVILTGEGTIDASALGGLAEQRVGVGDKVLSGCLNRGETLRIRAEVAFADSALARQLKLLHRANKEKTGFERRLERAAAWYAPALLALAVLFGLFVPLFTHDWAWGLQTAALLLALASPSALLLSLGLCFLGGLAGAFRRGLYPASKAALERLSHVRVVAFGKTGTVTDGKLRVREVMPVRVDRDTLLHMAARIEAPFRHPVAMAIREAANWTDGEDEAPEQAEEFPGRGVSAFVDGAHVLVGNAALLRDYGVEARVPEQTGSAVHVAVDGRYWGYLLIGDSVRESAFDAIEELRGAGVRNITLLTGDVRSVSAQIARRLNFDMVKSELSPEEKLSALRFLRRSLGRGETLAYVGDGFHDAALFEEADVGIALKPTGESESEFAADLVLMDDELLRVPAAIRLSALLRRLMLENLGAFCLVRPLILLLWLFGWVSLSAAALLTLLSGALPMLNALRSFLVEEQVLE